MAKPTTTESSLLIAVIGDIHLRDTQYATSRRGLDFFDAARRAVIAACKSEADILISTGDNFDVARPSAKVIGQMVQLNQELVKRGKRMLCITGNHDYSNPTWLETLFPVDDDADHSSLTGIIPIDGRTVVEKGFKITGLPPYTAAAFREQIAHTELQVRESDVIVYHGFVTGITPVYAGNSNALDVSELPTSASTKAILLGDIHVQQYISRKGAAGQDVLVGYQGSLEMCSSSESTEKSIPLIRVDREGASVVDKIPLTIRPFITRKVHTEEDLDRLIADVTAVADQHPVVPVEFDRSLPQTLSRLHSVLDAQRAVIRCYPLPNTKEVVTREQTSRDSSDLGMEHFISKKFNDSAELTDVALQLFARGESDAANIISAFIESRLNNTGIRD